VQSFVYGLSGLRIEDDSLAEAYAPVLPPGWKSLTLRRVTFRGKHYDIRIDRDADGKAKLTRTAL
jgi:protein-glucosylgalactosylhydroxylysine glucosidase